MAKIEIIFTPAGQAPEWVRKEWVGLEFPVKDISVEEHPMTGVLGGEPKPENINGYPVDTKLAVEILAAKSPEAAEWWACNISFVLHPTLVFGRQFCRFIP